MSAAPAPAPAPSPRPNQGSEPRAPRPDGAPPRPPRGGRGRGSRTRTGGRPGTASDQIRRSLGRPGGSSQGGDRAEKKAPEYLPAAPGKDVVRIVPLGGVEEVGRNMFTVEANGDIFVFDVGFQFVSEDTQPGV
ncbi:MAG: hypothetical protein Q8S35_02840, partial [bacterium]|nr:hypothetical protein [bacterium]